MRRHFEKPVDLSLSCVYFVQALEALGLSCIFAGFLSEDIASAAPAVAAAAREQQIRMASFVFASSGSQLIPQEFPFIAFAELPELCVACRSYGDGQRGREERPLR